MTTRALVIAAIVYRMLLLGTQRLAGMEWDFHVDATFYVDRILDMAANGLGSAINLFGLENLLYAAIGYLLYALLLEAIPPQYLLITMNIVFSAMAVALACGLSTEKARGRATAPGIFIAFSPYLAHLSIHPLKDIFIVFISIATLYALTSDRWTLALLAGVALILSRSYLGVLIFTGLLVWRLSLATNLKISTQVLFYMLASLAFLFATMDILEDRQEVEFEGRSFFPSGFALVPNSAEARFLLGGFFNFLVPFPFIPSNAAESGYLAHTLFFWFMMIWVWIKTRLKSRDFNRASFGLMLLALFSLSFILATTPGAGPLVRYRLFSEILLLIALQGVAVSTRRKTNHAAELEPYRR